MLFPDPLFCKALGKISNPLLTWSFVLDILYTGYEVQYTACKKNCKRKRERFKVDDKLKPVERSKSLKEQAYEKIKEAILEGGETVAGHSESQLAKVLHISRTPVREALLLLVKEGLVKLLPQQGVLVLQLTQDGLEEVFDLRAALETLSVEKLAKTISPDDLKRLKDLLARQRQAANLKNRVEFMDADEEFHLLIPELARLHKTREIIKNLRDQIRLAGYRALAHPGRMREVVREHEKLIVAMSRHDSAGAKRAILEHLARTEEALFQDQGDGRVG